MDKLKELQEKLKKGGYVCVYFDASTIKSKSGWKLVGENGSISCVDTKYKLIHEKDVAILGAYMLNNDVAIECNYGVDSDNDWIDMGDSRLNSDFINKYDEVLQYRFKDLNNPTIEYLKKKYESGNYICVYKKYSGNAWSIWTMPTFNDEPKHYKLIHIKHKDILEAKMKDNNVDIEYHLCLKKWETIMSFFIDYDEKDTYRIKQTKKSSLENTFCVASEEHKIKLSEDFPSWKGAYFGDTLYFYILNNEVLIYRSNDFEDGAKEIQLINDEWELITKYKKTNFVKCINDRRDSGGQVMQVVSLQDGKYNTNRGQYRENELEFFCEDGKLLKIFDAVRILNNEVNILICDNGDKLQKYSDTQIWVTYCPKRMERENSNSTGGTIENDEFAEKFKDNVFMQELQWFQKKYKLPLLCRVQKDGWGKPKTVMLNYFSGTMFNTGYGESYMPSYNTIITPLTDTEIEALKGGY